MGNKATYNNETGLYVLEMWSNRPPTNDEITSLGATIVPYKRKTNNYVGEAYNGNVDVFTRVNYSCDSTIATHKHLTRTNDRMVDASWANVLYIIRVNGIRVANILRVRKTNALIVFNVYGEPVKSIPTRKHIKPTYIQKQFKWPILPTIECVQLDSIRATHQNNPLRIEKVYAPNGMRMVNYDYRPTNSDIDDMTVLENTTEVVNRRYSVFYGSICHKTDMQALDNIKKEKEEKEDKD